MVEGLCRFALVATAVIGCSGDVLIASDTVKSYEYVNIARQHVLRRRSEVGTNDRRHVGGFELPITIDAKNWTLALQPATSLFAQTATDGAGRPLSTHGFYQGEVVSVTSAGAFASSTRPEKSFAHFRVREDGIAMGFFRVDNETYYVRPSTAAASLTKLGQPRHVAYKASDVLTDDHPKFLGCTDHGDFDTSVHSTQRHRRAASPHVAGRNTCPIALYLDSAFVNHYGTWSGMSLAIEMLTDANTIFESTAFTQGTITLTLAWIDYHGSNTAAAVGIQSLLNLATAGDAQSYLEQFSKHDWDAYCLAHVVTYIDFSGTLGLAWTGYVDSANHNGGICQARYNDPRHGGMSLNTAFSTSLNYGNPQPLRQSMLVMTHEYGHNMGSTHDTDQSLASSANGVYIMYAFANDGTKANNDNFSPESIASISAVIADRGGCFVEASEPVCGNTLIESNATDPTTGSLVTGSSVVEEVCDAGANANDACCNAGLTGTQCRDENVAFKPGKTCSPRSPTFGPCCNPDTCTFETTSTICGAESECRNPGTCTERSSGELHAGMLFCPPEASRAAKPDGLTCEVGVILGAGETGSSVCNSGVCDRSICELLQDDATGASYEPCSTITGSGACVIQCRLTSTGPCTAIDAITGLAPGSSNAYRVVKSGIQSNTAISNTETDEFIIGTTGPELTKPAGAMCPFRADAPTSGICDNSGECKEADGESDSLAELREAYSKYNKAFLDWANEETAGLKNWIWLLIGGIMLIFSCCAGCYVANKPEIQQMRMDRQDRLSARKRKPVNPHLKPANI